MNKGLEALKEIEKELRLNDIDKYINLFQQMNLSIIEKELKALEILIKMYKPKKYSLDAWLFAEIITKEEYELLREILQ